MLVCNNWDNYLGTFVATLSDRSTTFLFFQSTPTLCPLECYDYRLIYEDAFGFLRIFKTIHATLRGDYYHSTRRYGQYHYWCQYLGFCGFDRVTSSSMISPCTFVEMETQMYKPCCDQRCICLGPSRQCLSGPLIQRKCLTACHEGLLGLSHSRNRTGSFYYSLPCFLASSTLRHYTYSRVSVACVRPIFSLLRCFSTTFFTLLRTVCGAFSVPFHSANTRVRVSIDFNDTQRRTASVECIYHT